MSVVRQSFLHCPVTGEPLSADTGSDAVPVLLPCGHTLSRAAVRQILDGCDGYDGLDGSSVRGDCDGCCPFDGQPLKLTRLEDFRVNRCLVDLVETSRRDVAEDLKLRRGQLEYYTDRVLGRGRSGKVFRGTLAHSRGHIEAVAVKVVWASHAREEEGRAAHHELSLRGSVACKLADQVMALRGWKETGDCKLLIAMELAACSLRDVLQTLPGKRMPPVQWIDAALQVANAQAKLHALNIVHHDLSPGSVMRSQSGVFKLGDVGVSHTRRGTLRSGEGAASAGSMIYRAPEASNAEGCITVAADIWAFAATFLEAATGASPYGDASPEQIRRRHEQGSAPPFEQHAAILHAGVQHVLAACFASEPSARPSAADLFQRLLSCKHQMCTTPGVPAPPPAAPSAAPSPAPVSAAPAPAAATVEEPGDVGTLVRAAVVRGMRQELADDVMEQLGSGGRRLHLRHWVGILGETDCEHLAAVLRRMTHLCSLHINAANLRNKGASALAPSLACLTQLEQLELCRNSIGADGAIRLTTSMAGLGCLTALDLSRNAIGARGAAALPSLVGLQSLDLSANGLGSQGVEALAPRLACLTQLVALQLGNNDIGATGISALSQSLAGLTQLTCLQLWSNGIGASGAAKLAPSLERLARLRILSLSSNGIGATGAAELARTLRRLSTLESLDMGFNDLRTQGAAHLAPSLAGLPRLCTLLIGGNGISDAGRASLAATAAAIRARGGHMRD